jgi:hypothetical protein
MQADDCESCAPARDIALRIIHVMSTLADPKIQSACCDRLGRIAPGARARWGRMTAHQMICHLNDSFKLAMGEKSASPTNRLYHRTLMKWAALHTPIQWPQGVPTRPEMEQGRGGTPPADWEQDRMELRGLMVRFPALTRFGTHPMFGAMSRNEWMIWGYRHVDHHLRQFGL